MKFVDRIHSSFKVGENKSLTLSEASEAFAYYPDYRVNLISGLKEKYNIDEFLEGLSGIKVGNYQDDLDSKRVIHLYFELGYMIKDIEVDKDQLLAIDLQFNKSSVDSCYDSTSLKIRSFKCVDEILYTQNFERIYEQLLLGNAYQVNLTFPVALSFKKVSAQLLSQFYFSQLNKLSAYAHYSWIPLIDSFILSNSPECLFFLKNKSAYTMPIKGTVKSCSPNWKEELTSPKNLAELNMITDLMRNDLSAIDGDISYVQAPHQFLQVSKLAHMYSVIMANLSDSVTLRQCVEALFPGGSITGAPKKRVLEIIKDVEKYDRGVYCGSTILQYGGRVSCSINIRTLTGTISSNHFLYGAGGGITLNSNAGDEYQEALNKFHSFYSLFN